MASCGGAPGIQTGGVAHAAGANELVLRISVGGGYAGLPTQPQVSLFGDGTVIYLDAREPYPARVGDVQPQRPYRMARLSEDQLQAVLRAAIPAIGPARARYAADGADYLTYVYTLRAGGIEKTVSLFGMEADVQSGQDAAAWAAFRELAREVGARLADMEQSAVYDPVAFEMRLWRRLEPAQAVAWPWPKRPLEDFPSTPNGTAFVGRLSAAEVAALGFPSVQGGLDGLVLLAPDGMAYNVEIRPLLPDEAS
jgi:hypothetical protein